MHTVVRQTNYVKRPGWPLFTALAGLLLFPAGEAAAVWAHRPFCEDERGTLDSRKDSLDRCIDAVERKVQDDSPNAKEQAQHVSPCAPELEALIAAGKDLNRCVEKIWWMRKKKSP
jgi:hypothetical protein